ncbi:MFS transporter [Gordonia crocea]|uniref:MFS transporter n=1 Tax=Gordonia crocea TaxID=589162 RepID=UPI00137A5202|nr:MFS transporter [Gordonia crocea]
MGFLIEAVALGVMVAADDLVLFVGAALVYGIGLGSVDAACNMQGALAEAKASRPVFGRLYAAYTAAAILGAVATAAVLWLRLPALSAIAGAAVFGVVVAGLSVTFGDPYITVRTGADQDKRRHRECLPVRGIVLTGSLVFAAFVVDSAVASWSTLYLRDGLASSPTVAPFGYAAYLAVVLLGRLAADPMVLGWGRKTTGVVGVGMALAGCLIVAAVAAPAAAVAGFALAGAVAGLLVPVAFSWAGELSPARSDEVIARVNLFNYGGAIVGAVALGVLAGNAANLGYGFVLPGLALVAAIGVLRMITQGAGPDSVGVEAS